MARSRNFVFTLNNYTPEEVEAVKQWDCSYLIFGKEVGESGTPHLQGYLSLVNAKTLTALKKLSARAHWEVARGTPKQASEYCEKDGDVFEKGTRPLSQAEKGAKEVDRWEAAYKAVEDNRLEDVPKDILCSKLKNIQYAVDQVRSSKRKLDTIDGELEHEWYYGPPGTGKSRKARMENPGAYIKDPTNKWWDGYTGQEVVIIDDFDKYCIGQSSHMKRWTDRYVFPAETKGGKIEIRPRKIITTSNLSMDQIWNDPTDQLAEAMKRRHKETYFPLAAPGSGDGGAPARGLRFVAPNIQTRPPDSIAFSHGSGEAALGGDPPSPNRFTSLPSRL